MPFCDNSGDLNYIQTMVNEFSDPKIYRKETDWLIEKLIAT